MSELKAATIANLLLGAWLVLSAALWWRTPAHVMSSVAVGALAILFALAARRAPMALLANAALAIWLFASIWVLSTPVAIVANHMVVATLLFGFAVAPAELGNAELGGRATRRA